MESTLRIFVLVVVVVAEGCSSAMSKLGAPVCWVNVNSVWTECKDVSSTACDTVCQNSAMLSSQCTSDKSGNKDGSGKDVKDNSGKKETQQHHTGTNDFAHTWANTVKTRTYSWKRASTYPPAGMVVVLQPGGGSCGSLSSLAHSSNLLVVCPLTLGSTGWKAQLPHDSEDVDFIAELITSLTTSQSVPAGKVIVSGFSFGGTMAFRLLCERSDVVGGIVPMGQSFLEPAGGHVAKGTESASMTTTQQALQLMNEARNGANKCDPATKRPHYALVGTADTYYGEASGAYKGKTLWEFYSTIVQGCTGQLASSTPTESQDITGKTGSTCYHYPSCPGLSTGSLNQYCTVQGFGHETTGWEVLVANAFGDFF